MKTGIMISKAQFESNYTIVEGSNTKQKLEVAFTPSLWRNERLAEVSDTYSHSYLVNFKAVEPRKIQSVIEAFGDEDEIDMGDLKNLLFVHEIIVNEGQSPSLPCKGEMVECICTERVKDGEYVTDINDERIIYVKALTILAAKTNKKFTFSLVDKMKERVQVSDEAPAVETKSTKKAVAKF